MNSLKNIVILLTIGLVQSFTTNTFGCKTRAHLFLSFSNLVDNLDEHLDIQKQRETSFLKFIGPYPALSLRFPSLSTSSQRKRNVTGVALDFILDTAANTNTINAQVATELSLDVVGDALPGFGATGSISGGQTFGLGNCTIDRLDADLFMTNLTASALPVASPAAAGLLGVAFLNCFEAVKFVWGGGIEGKQPLVTFYGDTDDANQECQKFRRVPLDVLDTILLPSVIININGVRIPALLDTGSPVTVLNAAAANATGLEVFKLDTENSDKRTGGFNPFKAFTDNLRDAKSMADAASRGEILVIASSDGKQIELKRTKNSVSVSLGSGEVQFPPSNIYVGDLPGLAALNGLNPTSPPAAILGMDVIKRLPMMIYRKDAIYL